METIRQKLHKIACLAASGVGGEQENARRMLHELAAKHGLSVDELTTEETAPYSFAAKDRFELTLLRQVIVHVCQTTAIRNGPKSKGIRVWLTPTQAADVREAFEHYRAIWRRDVQDFAEAFIHKNAIYGPRSETSADRELTAEERERLRRLRALMLGMEDNRWERRLKLTA